MSNNRKFDANYAALYPGVTLTSDVLAALKESDRKMKYMECDLKFEGVERDDAGSVVKLLPSREDSYDRLLDMDKQFAAATPSPEQVFFASEEQCEIRRCIAMLDAADQELIAALFYEGQSIREYAAAIGISRSAVHRRKQKILRRLKNYFLKLPD